MSSVEQARVEQGFDHRSRIVNPQASLKLGDTVLKWYDIAPPEASIPLAVHALARRNLREAWRMAALPLAGELGFVMLHRCGVNFYFLLVATWRNRNELWETVWTKVNDEAPRFGPLPAEDSHRSFSVWELGAVAHERNAWNRYLTTSRDELARRAYLRDTFDGEV
jgi:hypothetical protein